MKKVNKLGVILFVLGFIAIGAGLGFSLLNNKKNVKVIEPDHQSEKIEPYNVPTTDTPASEEDIITKELNDKHCKEQLCITSLVFKYCQDTGYATITFNSNQNVPDGSILLVDKNDDSNYLIFSHDGLMPSENIELVSPFSDEKLMNMTDYTIELVAEE